MRKPIHPWLVDPKQTARLFAGKYSSPKAALAARPQASFQAKLAAKATSLHYQQQRRVDRNTHMEAGLPRLSKEVVSFSPY